MSQRRKAMLEVICFVTGLSAREIKARPELCSLLSHADTLKGIAKKYRYGIFTFWWPRKKKNGTVVPFLGLSVDCDGMEKQELQFRTFDLKPDGMDAEFGLTDKEVERFVKARAKARAKAQAKKAEKETAKVVKSVGRRRAVHQRLSAALVVLTP